MAILLLALLHIAFFLVSIESRPDPLPGGNFDDFLSYTTTKPGSKSEHSWAPCVEKCFEKYMVGKSPPSNPFPTLEELQPLCESLPCIDECKGARKFVLFAEFLCYHEDYNSSLVCMNKQYPKISGICLTEQYGSKERGNNITTTSLPTTASAPPTKDSAHKEMCQFVSTFHQCVEGKMHVECGKEAGYSFGVFSRFVMALMTCPK